ncbi:MAG: C-GCAxxG-C-C family protein [Spirochaetes bacterium]|jgi:C_GCAxxG_C_C family probable redox protein|nr:C-GCAxxG-C-C family protein [Spirochaetota bacterium]
MKNDKAKQTSPRMVFWKRGACSTAMCHLINREFTNERVSEEDALCLLAGGIAQKGHQCGMLWGASLACGIESYRRYGSSDAAVKAVINASKIMIESFQKRAGSVNCQDITNTNLQNKWQFFVFMFKVIIHGFVFSPCFNLIARWTPEVLIAANEGLTDQKKCKTPCVSCASEVLKKMGASDEDTMSVAGFAGGIGLSGHACGALSAVIWYKMLLWCRDNLGRTPSYFNNPDAKKVLRAFYSQTDSEMLCSKISGKHFDNVEQHSEFIKNGGCDKLINTLSAL